MIFKKDERRLNLPPLPPPKMGMMPTNVPKDLPPLVPMNNNMPRMSLPPLPPMQNLPPMPVPRMEELPRLELQPEPVEHVPDLTSLPKINLPSLDEKPVTLEELQGSRQERDVYIKLTTYKEIISTMNLLRGKLAHVEGQIQALQRLKEKEVEDVKEWHDSIQDIKKRLLKINSQIE